LSVLERALGLYFRPTGSGSKGQPEQTSSFIHLEFTRQPHALATNDGNLKLFGAFNVTLDPSAEDDSVNLLLNLGCPVLEDDDHEGDDLNLNVDVSGVEAQRDPNEPHIFRFTLLKGTKAHFGVESEPYDPAWTVRLRPEINAETAS